MFLFEDLPASDRRADNVYLTEVDHCEVYVGLFGDEFGNEDEADIHYVLFNKRITKDSKDS